MVSKIITGFYSENKWIIFATLFFAIWKFFLIHTMFELGLEDPRFNDAHVYIQHIESINQNGSLTTLSSFLFSFKGYGGFEHLTYRLFFGYLAFLLNVSSVQMFIASFYIGTLFLITTLAVFLHRINSNKKLLALSLFFLSLFNGAGSFHGFFWVVPSLFALIIFLFIFSVILGDFVHWKLYIVFLTPSLLYTHFLGLYLAVVPILFVLIYWIITWQIQVEALRKTTFFLFMLMLFYIPTAVHLTNSPYGGNAYGIEVFSKEISTSINGAHIKTSRSNPDTYLPGFPQIRSDYFDWLFPHWSGVILFLAIIMLLLYYKQYRLLALYFSTLLFTILSSVHPYGMRSLLLTWPMTYVLYAYGTWFAFVYIRDIVRNRILRTVCFGIASLMVFIFVSINVVYSYTWNTGYQISIKSYIKDILIQ